MKTFEQFLTETDFSWWRNLIVPLAMRPHHIPVVLANAAVTGTGIGALAGLWRAISRLSPSEIPKGIARWQTGLLTNWRYTPKWAEAVQNPVPPQFQKEADELVQLGQQLQANKNNPQQYQQIQDLLIQKSKTFFELMAKASKDQKSQAMNQPQS